MLSEKAFTIKMAMMFRGVRGVRSVHQGDLELQLFLDPEIYGVTGATVNLANVWEGYYGHGQFQREADRLYTSWMSQLNSIHINLIAQSLEKVEHLIYPKIVTEDYMAELHSQNLIHISQPWRNGLLIAYVIDAPKSMLMVTEDMRNGWDLAVEGVHRRAMVNLQQLPMPWEWAEPDTYNDLLARIDTSDGHAAARILRTEDIRDAFGHHRHIAFALPHRDLLIVGTEDGPVNFGRLVMHAEIEYSQSPYYNLTPEVLHL